MIRPFAYAIILAIALTEYRQPVQAATYPASVFDWPVFERQGDLLTLAPRVRLFKPRNPLFSDYAEKLRTIWVPEGSHIEFNADATFHFPVGTVLSKTFYYATENLKGADQEPLTGLALNTTPVLSQLAGKHLVETRILFKTPDGWRGVSYHWSDDQNSAKAAIIGKSIKVTYSDERGEQPFTYQIPNINQCKSCHISYDGFDKTIKPIGPTPLHLDFDEADRNGEIHNQLDDWLNQGLIASIPPDFIRRRLVGWDDENARVQDRARAYLDINCAHCHNPTGSADTSSLHLGYLVNQPLKIGVCKSPVATGNGGVKEGFIITPGDPAKSILARRIDSTDPAVMMPEIGRHLVHAEGLSVIEQWIAGMDGSCFE